MKKIISSVLVLVGLMLGSQAYAHVSYNGRDLIDNAHSTTINGDGSTTYNWNGGLVGGNYGWADGTDADWGDSHRIRFTKFEITNPGGANVDISVWASDAVKTLTTDTDGGTGDVAALGDLNPAFTMYKGVLPPSAYDWPVVNGANGTPHADDLRKEGLFQAFENVTMSNNSGVVGTLEYLTHVGAVNSTDSSVSLLSYFLAPGMYTMAVGGASGDGIPLFANAGLDNANRGFLVEMTVQPVPVPAAVWLMGSALVGLIGMRKQRAMAA